MGTFGGKKGANNYNRQGARKALSLHGACHGSTRQSEDWAVANSPGGLSRKPTRLRSGELRRGMQLKAPGRHFGPENDKSCRSRQASRPCRLLLGYTCFFLLHSFM